MGSEISNVFSNLTMILKNLNNLSSENTIRLNIGQIVEAQVLSKNEDLYLLKNNDRSFYAKSETELEIGQKILLQVLGNKDELVYLKRVLDLPRDNENNTSENSKQLLKKFGEMTEKEIQQIMLAIREIPCESNTAARYLLDPYLLTAILLPSPIKNEEYDKIEINSYKNGQSKQDVFEVFLDLSLSRLGHIEIMVRSVANNIYARIWAASEETEELLKTQIKEIEEMCSHVEIVPLVQGPLIIREMQKNLDIRI